MRYIAMYIEFPDFAHRGGDERDRPLGFDGARTEKLDAPIYIAVPGTRSFPRSRRNDQVGRPGTVQTV